jgi:hydrogenase small subunit
MMTISRRSFLRYCTASAAVLGLDPLRLGLLGRAMANPAAPSVIWLHGSSCTGCSVSLLNRITATGDTIATVLVNDINLVFHATLMASAGDPAVAELLRVRKSGNYVLVCEGGVPTAFGGRCCITYGFGGGEITYMQAVQELAAGAAAIVCAGTCASFGGIPRSGSNPTGVVSIRELTGRPTINISGCPANPDWMVWAIVQLLTGTPVTLDENGRPVDLYAKDLAGGAAPALIHDKCPRNPDLTGTPLAAGFGENGHCLEMLGCRGPFTKARCEACWNGVPGQGAWCIGVNAPCHGCTEPGFPGPQPFYEPFSG